MFLNSANSRLLSASLLDKEQLEENERARRQGETQRQVASALLVPPSGQTRCRSAPDPITEGFFGTNLFGKLLTRQSSNSSRRDSGDSVTSQFGVVDSQQRQSRRGSWVGHTNMVSLLDREQLSSSRERKRSYSLVSCLDTTQTGHIPDRAPEERHRDVTQLNTLQEAIPVARAAARFRTVLEDNKRSEQNDPDHKHHHRGRHRRKSHSLY